MRLFNNWTDQSDEQQRKKRITDGANDLRIGNLIERVKRDERG